MKPGPGPDTLILAPVGSRSGDSHHGVAEVGRLPFGGTSHARCLLELRRDRLCLDALRESGRAAESTSIIYHPHLWLGRRL